MHKEILTAEQVELLPLVKTFQRDFYLVGGTAIALHLGHRRSIDFDLFTGKDFDNGKIQRKIERNKYKIERVARDEKDQFTLIIDGVYFTFFNFPYTIPCSDRLKGVISMPDLLTLAAMKAAALGRRGKWKDYVDLYFITRKYNFASIAKKAKELFGNEFNEKLFREQLSYFEDINYAEKIEFMPGFEVKDEEVKKYLTEASLSK